MMTKQRTLTPDEAMAQAYYRWRRSFGDEPQQALARVQRAASKGCLGINQALTDEFYEWLVS